MAGHGSAPGERRGGRQKGTPNKATQARQAAIAESGVTPLQYMIDQMRAPLPSPKSKGYPAAVLLKFEAAKAAAPYVHAKLASVELGNKPGETFKVGLLTEDGGIL